MLGKNSSNNCEAGKAASVPLFETRMNRNSVAAEARLWTDFPQSLRMDRGNVTSLSLKLEWSVLGGNYRPPELRVFRGTPGKSNEAPGNRARRILANGRDGGARTGAKRIWTARLLMATFSSGSIAIWIRSFGNIRLFREECCLLFNIFQWNGSERILMEYIWMRFSTEETCSFLKHILRYVLINAVAGNIQRHNCKYSEGHPNFIKDINISPSSWMIKNRKGGRMAQSA